MRSVVRVHLLTIWVLFVAAPAWPGPHRSLKADREIQPPASPELPAVAVGAGAILASSAGVALEVNGRLTERAARAQATATLPATAMLATEEAKLASLQANLDLLGAEARRLEDEVANGVGRYGRRRPLEEFEKSQRKLRLKALKPKLAELETAFKAQIQIVRRYRVRQVGETAQAFGVKGKLVSTQVEDGVVRHFYEGLLGPIEMSIPQEAFEAGLSSAARQKLIGRVLLIGGVATLGADLGAVLLTPRPSDQGLVEAIANGALSRSVSKDGPSDRGAEQSPAGKTSGSIEPRAL